MIQYGTVPEQSHEWIILEKKNRLINQTKADKQKELEAICYDTEPEKAMNGKYFIKSYL